MDQAPILGRSAGIRGCRLGSFDGALRPGDEFQVGRSRFVFVNQLEDLPSVPLDTPGETLSIKKRLTQSRFLTPHPHDFPTEMTQTALERRSVSQDLMLLYRLG